MTIPSAANLMENPLKAAHKSKKYQKAKGMSFFACLLISIVMICISIFYIFGLSPSTLFINSSKFWFVISNTLILIIAADYGAFSSSKDQKRDLYEEYALHSQARRRSTDVPSFVSQYPEIVENSIPKEEESLKDQKDKEDVADEIPEEEVVKIEHETDNFQGKISQQRQHPMKADNYEACDQVINKKKIEPKTIRRSKSDKVNVRVTFHEKKNNLQRSKTGKHEQIAKENESPAEDQNEFSTMSDEELNRRVEEFIQKFNRQIRLQGA